MSQTAMKPTWGVVRLRYGEEFVVVARESRRRGKVVESNCGFAPGSIVEIRRETLGEHEGWIEAERRVAGARCDRTRVTPGMLGLLRCAPFCGHPDCEAVRDRIAHDDAMERLAREEFMDLGRFIRVYRAMRGRGKERLQARGVIRARRAASAVA